jgi:hypothetical protein
MRRRSAFEAVAALRNSRSRSAAARVTRRVSTHSMAVATAISTASAPRVTRRNGPMTCACRASMPETE